jgi:hypothetical protein
MQTTYPRIRRWTRVEYDRLIDQGVFQPDERLELLAGQLVVREPQGDPHSLGEHGAPLAAPTSHIAVVDLLP